MPLGTWKRWARQLKQEVRVLYLALRDPRTPWYARAAAGCVVAYALSPIDLIPDPIPILGYLDDLVIVPLGILLVRRMIPRQVMHDCRQRSAQPLPARWRWFGGAIILVLWLAVASAIAAWIIARR